MRKMAVVGALIPPSQNHTDRIEDNAKIDNMYV